MKTKLILVTIIALFIAFGVGCGQEPQYLGKSIVGEWQLIKQNVSSGIPTQTETVSNGYVVKFDAHGSVITSVYACDGKYSVSNNDATLTVQFNCQTNAGVTLLSNSKLSFQGNDTLSMSSLNSDEPYFFIYKRLK